MDTTWDRYLFKKYNLVALNPLETNVQLFTLLCKKHQEGKHPVLNSIGSLGDIRSATPSNSEWDETADKITSYRKGKLKEDGLVEKRMNGLLKCDTYQSCGVLAGLLKLFKIDGGRSKQLIFQAHNVQTESIDCELKEELFRHSDPLWVPDMKRIQLEKSISKDGTIILQDKKSKDGSIELWVVTEIKYCTDMMLELRDQGSGGSHIGVPVELTGNIPVDFKVEVTKNNGLKIIAKGEQVPIGFKAIRLVYDCNGQLQGRANSLGTVQPYLRAGDDECDEFDPDNDPCYHMAGLYVDASQEHCLETE